MKPYGRTWTAHHPTWECRCCRQVGEKHPRAAERRVTERLIAEDPPFENECDAGTCRECAEAPG